MQILLKCEFQKIVQRLRNMLKYVSIFYLLLIIFRVYKLHTIRFIKYTSFTFNTLTNYEFNNNFLTHYVAIHVVVVYTSTS